MQTSRKFSVLGLFPQFGEGHLGGIQASARIGWQAIVAKSSSAELVCYSRQQDFDPTKTTEHNSRARALLAALKQKEPTDTVIVWQIGLLKLLPFLRHETRRIVLFLHGIEAWKPLDWLTRRLVRKVDLFLSNSEHTWTRFLSYHPELRGARHQTVSLGIGDPITGSTSSPSSKPSALMLSRLSRNEDYKGHRETIEAWPLVLKLQPQAELCVAGAGDLRSELEQLVRTRGLVDRVKFLSSVGEQHKQRLLEESRCLLMPSRAEGFGLVYLEAMRVGRPCLVSTIDAGREVVNPPEAGLAVDPQDRQSLANAISRLLSDSDDWQKWSARARQRYEQNYTAHHFQERLVAALF